VRARRLGLSLALCVAAAAVLGGHVGLDAEEQEVVDAIVRIRQALPDGWDVADIRWDTVPAGWTGDSSCVLVRVEDETIRFHDDTGGFTYRPFYKIWILPVAWEGRGEVADLHADVPQALYLGETDRLRFLYRTLGRNTWPEGKDVLGSALGLDAYPLSPHPQHSLDVRAMAQLYRRLDTRPGALERWQRRIYGIEELPSLIYLELLTWDDRRGAEDPTYLGDLAERETTYLSRQVLAAFPEKRGLYLRRVTQDAFSDVLVVNAARVNGTN
jgi:hypothetical protein